MNMYFRLLAVYAKLRRRPKIGIWETGVTTFRVLPNDLDLLGHMNNGRYLTLMDLGRMDLMLRAGYWRLLTARGWYPVVAGQTITYRKSLNPFQQFELHTRMLGFDEHGAYVEQEFRVGDTLYAKAHVRARFLKKMGGKVSDTEIADLLGTDMDAAPGIPDWVSQWGSQNRGLTQIVR